jgi:ribosomal protein L16/L10AE
MKSKAKQQKKVPKQKAKKKQPTTVSNLYYRTSSHSTNLSRPDSYTVFARSFGKCEITDKHQKAFKKSYFAIDKSYKKIFQYNGIPYVELTKKPGEVRMGKGKGTRINRRLFPVASGQIIISGNVKPKYRVTKSATTLLKKACYKLPRKCIISRSDL